MVLHLREKKRNLCHNRDFPLFSTDSFYKRLKTLHWSKTFFLSSTLMNVWSSGSNYHWKEARHKVTDFNLPACSIKIWIKQKTYYHLYAWNSAPKSEKGNSLWNTHWCTWRKSVHMCKFQNRQKRNIRKVYMYCNISSQWKKKTIWLTKQQLQHLVALGEYMYIACRTRFLKT